MSHDRFNSFSSIIEALGELALAEVLKCSRHQPRDWRLRNSIPPEWWSPLVEYATENGHPEISLELLADLARKEAGKRKKHRQRQGDQPHTNEAA